MAASVVLVVFGCLMAAMQLLVTTANASAWRPSQAPFMAEYLANTPTS